MMTNLMTILERKAFISSNPRIVLSSCPPPCGHFSIQESATGGLSYKLKKAYIETDCNADFYSFGTYYVNDKVPYDLEEMPKDLYIQKRKLAKLYVSQRTTVRKMYHMLPYEYWQKEDF